MDDEYSVFFMDYSHEISHTKMSKSENFMHAHTYTRTSTQRNSVHFTYIMQQSI